MPTPHLSGFSLNRTGFNMDSNTLNHSSTCSPFSLTFKDVCYSVEDHGPHIFKRKKPSKQIVHNVSGHVAPGEFLAILGPSGAGKSTLLNLLAARSEDPPSSGTILFSGRPRTPRTKRYIGYVMQDDVFFSKLTVRETLMFTADIRLPRSMTRQQRAQRVDTIISKMGLEKCKDTKVGDTLERGISGGERKRLNIANEIIHQPSLLLADECTSGLDASSALRVLNMLDELRHEGRTIVVSIHQPSSRMFSMFSKVLLLASGRVAYFGNPQTMVSYFMSLDFPFPGTAYNPADYVLELVMDNGDDGDLVKPNETETTEEETEIVTSSRQERILNAWAGRSKMTVPSDSSNETDFENDSDDIQKRQVVIPVDGMGTESTSDGGVKVPTTNSMYQRKPPTTHYQRYWRAVSKRASEIVGSANEAESQKYTTGWWSQACALMRRAVRQKQGLLLQGTSIAQVIIATICTVMFWFRVPAKEQHIEDRLGLLSFFGVSWGFASVNMAIFAFPTERAVLTKDRANGVYRLSAYYFAKSIVEMPADTLYPLMSCTVIYFLTNMNPDIRAFLTFCVIYTLNVLVGQSIGLFVSSIFMNLRMSQTLGSAWVLVSLLTSGYIIDPENIPDPLKFVRYLSFLRYSYDSAVRNEFSYGRTYQCADLQEEKTIYSGNGDPARCPINLDSLLKGAGIENALPIWGGILVQISWIIILRLLGYFALKTLHTKHKPKLSAWK